MAGRVRDTRVRVARRDTKRPRRSSSAAGAGAGVGEVIGVDPAAYLNRKFKRAALRMLKGEATVGPALTAEDLPDTTTTRRRVTRVQDHLEEQLQEWAEQLLPPRAQSAPDLLAVATEAVRTPHAVVAARASARASATVAPMLWLPPCCGCCSCRGC
jgi:hypothetical protein|eukprot:COSAG01_NODE_15324_length_1348_cov_39.875100_2_plen_157_part_00